MEMRVTPARPPPAAMSVTPLLSRCDSSYASAHVENGPGCSLGLSFQVCPGSSL